MGRRVGRGRGHLFWAHEQWAMWRQYKSCREDLTEDGRHEECASRPGGVHRAVGRENRDLISNPGGGWQIVEHDEDGHPHACDVPQQGLGEEQMPRIHGRSRFIGEEGFLVGWEGTGEQLQHRAGQGDALALSGGEVVKRLMKKGLQVQGIDHALTVRQE